MVLHLEIQFLHLEALHQIQGLHNLELRNQEALVLLELILAHPVPTITIRQAQEAILILHQEAVVLLQDLAEAQVVVLEVEVQAEDLEVEVLEVEVRDKKYNL